MLKIDQKYVSQAQAAETSTDLEELLQHALRLEHSTIPPYLTAAYSLKSGSSGDVLWALKKIAEEEMLHMAVLANIINAIGGRPNMAEEGFIPRYPTALPMTIGGDLEVGLKKFSPELVHDVFMKIEEPETPLEFQLFESALDSPATFGTIGEFYKAVADRIRDLGDGVFIGDPARQVVISQGTPWQMLQPITDAVSAVKALEWIVEDGEGTTQSPLDHSGETAHYYRFAEIYHGRRLREDPTAENGYSYSGEELRVDPSLVWDLPDSPRVADYPEESLSRQGMNRFNQLYSDMLRDLQAAFDGQHERLDPALGKMGRLRTAAGRTVQIIDPDTGKSIGFSYEYRPPEE